MMVLQYCIRFVEFVLLLYLSASVCYYFVFASASLFPYKKKRSSPKKLRKTAILIPGYKEDLVICHTAEKALEQNYPTELFDVVIIADSFQPETIHKLKQLPVKLIEVSFEKSTKSKALNKAMELLGDDYETALVLDADNLMEPLFLQKINEAFDRGFRVVQAHRSAKNQDTPLAILDALSEEINNSIFRKGHRVLGFSSALIGSGMAFDYAYFKDIMLRIKAIGGFDKELELNILQEGLGMEYLEDAYVYDEKVSEADNFSRQRRRWLSAQFIYFAKFFLPGLKHLFLKANFDFFDKVIQMILAPRILLLGFLFLANSIALILNLINNPYILSLSFFSWKIWLFLLMLLSLTLILAIPRKMYDHKMLKAILFLPRGFFLMLSSLLKIKGANKNFLHTVHKKQKKEQ
jgi:cellulose synthase/poly-beta-1,6-N-acetylglucosamine synthase-like glycosyltransferase